MTVISEEDRAYIIDEVERLVGTDSPERIAVRLGYQHKNSLSRALARWGRPDLAKHFERKLVSTSGGSSFRSYL